MSSIMPCDGGPCGWQSCAAGDASCQRALVATECILDPGKCPEAALRCAECDGGKSCPPAAYCRSDKDPDGHLRCAPGCVTDTDCALTDVCASGACAAAPPCARPACQALFDSVQFTRVGLER